MTQKEKKCAKHKIKLTKKLCGKTKDGCEKLHVSGKCDVCELCVRGHPLLTKEEL